MKTQTTAPVNDSASNGDSLLPKTPLQNLLHKSVTRKQFLKLVGLGLLSVLGFSTVLHFLTGKHPSAHIASVTAATSSRKGFGRF